MGNTQDTSGKEKDEEKEDGGACQIKGKGKKNTSIRLKLQRMRKKSVTKKIQNGGSSSISTSDQQQPKSHHISYLSTDEIRNLQETWAYMEMYMDNILHEAFVNMFQENPDLKEKFIASKENAANGRRHVVLKVTKWYKAKHCYCEEMHRYLHLVRISTLNMKDTILNAKNIQAMLNKHIPMVTRSLTKIMSHLDDLQSIADYLELLGKIHHQSGIQDYELLLIGPHFIAAAIKFIPSSHREKRIQENWLKIFTVMQELMKKGFPDISASLSETEIASVAGSLKLVRSQIDRNDSLTFSDILQNSVGSNKDGLQEILRESNHRNITATDKKAIWEAFGNHPILLVQVAEEMTSLYMLKNLPKMETYLEKLGQIHCTAGMPKRHLDIMGPLFCQAIRPILEADGIWSEELGATWLRFFEVMVLFMKRGYNSRNGGMNRVARQITQSFDDNSSNKDSLSSIKGPDPISPIKTDQLHYFIKNKPKRVSTGDLNIGVKSKLIPPHCHVCCTTQRKSTDVHNFDAIEVLENNSLQVDSGRGLDSRRNSSICLVQSTHNLQIDVSSPKARSTSVGNLLAQKIEQLRRSSDHELRQAAMSQIGSAHKVYAGNMLKKPNVPKNRNRSRSIDATSHLKIK